MPRLTDASRHERMSQIADAAARCFARNGFAGTSMADIITESGLSAGSIYSHFGGKAELALFTSEQLLEKRRASLAAMTRGQAAPTPIQVLTRLYEDIEPSSDMLVQIWAEAARDALIAELAREKIGQVRTLLVETLRPWAATQAGDHDTLAGNAADTIMLIFQGITVRRSIQPGTDPRAMLRSIGALLP